MSVRASVLLHPWPLLAAAVILLNALWLRQHYPGAVSGKLSDLGICFLLPVALAATWQWLLGLMGRVVSKPKRVAEASTLLAAAYYTGVELIPAWGKLHQGAIATLTGGALPLTRDPTDLLCLVMCLPAYGYLKFQATWAPASR